MGEQYMELSNASFSKVNNYNLEVLDLSSRRF
jgi:hypothetical protein